MEKIPPTLVISCWACNLQDFPILPPFYFNPELLMPGRSPSPPRASLAGEGFAGYLNVTLLSKEGFVLLSFPGQRCLLHPSPLNRSSPHTRQFDFS